MEEIVCAGKWTVKGVSSSKSVRMRRVHRFVACIIVSNFYGNLMYTPLLVEDKQC